MFLFNSVAFPRVSPHATLRVLLDCYRKKKSHPAESGRGGGNGHLGLFWQMNLKPCVKNSAECSTERLPFSLQDFALYTFKNCIKSTPNVF